MKSFAAFTYSGSFWCFFISDQMSVLRFMLTMFIIVPKHKKASGSSLAYKLPYGFDVRRVLSVLLELLPDIFLVRSFSRRRSAFLHGYHVSSIMPKEYLMMILRRSL